MARIPDLYPAGRAAGPFPPPPPFPPGPGSVSFTRKPAMGTQTIDALMQRQRELAERQAALSTQAYPGMGTIAGGLGNMVNQFTTGLADYRAREEEAAGRAELTQQLGGYDPDAADAQQRIAAIYSRDPELGVQLMADAIKARRDAASQEKFTTLNPEEVAQLGLDPAKDYQRSSLTGKVDQIGGGGTSVTVNPPSAETAAKLGLANGFLDNYDAILASAEAGEMTGTGWITGVQLGRGNGGTQYRNLLQGTEALVRMLTGAGMSEGEARGRVTQFEPAATDDAQTLADKIKGLKQALDNVREGVITRQPGGKADEQAEPPAAGEAQPFPEDGAPEVGTTYTFPDGTSGTYLGGDVSSPKSWKPVATGGP